MFMDVICIDVVSLFVDKLFSEFELSVFEKCKVFSVK